MKRENSKIDTGVECRGQAGKLEQRMDGLRRSMINEGLTKEDA